jgi:hypothetical protein
MNNEEFNDKQQTPEDSNPPASGTSKESTDENVEKQQQTEELENNKDLTEQSVSLSDEKEQPNEKNEAESSEQTSGNYSEQDELLPPAQSPYEEDEDEDEPDYSALSKDQLVAELERLLTEFEVQKIRKRVESIKTQFYKKHQKDIAKAKEVFLADGGEEKDFNPDVDSANEAFNNFMQIYRDKRIAYLDQIEQSKKDSLSARNDVIEGIKNLINKEESLNQTFQEFRALQDRWREIGKVPQNDVKSIWEKYHFAVEQFYDFVKINKELRDLDLRKNLDQKVELCAKAEQLLLEDSVVKAFKTLQDYHQKWREIGPVPRDKKEEVWERFREATVKVNKRHQEFFENLKKDQQKNLESKEELCKRVEEINKLNLVKPKKWEEKSKEIIEIQKLWKKIGFAPKKFNSEIYQRFKQACDAFFDAKRDFFSSKHSDEQVNLDKKTELCLQAETMKDSTDWKKTTADFIKLQKTWKQIGPVPRRHSEAIWKRFRSACDAFFDAKKDFFSNADQRQEDNLKLKEDLIAKVKEFELSGNDEADLKTLSDFQKDWSEIGFVPFNKKDDIQKEFRQAINKHFDSA